MSWVLIGLAVVAGLVVLWFTAMIVVALVETTHVCELAPAAGAGAPPPPPYVAAMSAQAAAAGYAPAAYLRHIKHAIVVALHVSPDRRTLAAIAGGTLLRIPVKRTVLLSRLTNEKILKTTDEMGLSDLTGLYARQLVVNASFAELRDAHDRWLAEAGDLVASYGDADPVAAYLAMDAEDAERQVAFGYSRYLDAGRTRFRHTLKGALTIAFRGFGQGMAEASKQRDRMDLPRPG